MSQSFFDHPILNSPYDPPSRYHALDKEGQPLEQPPIEGRRPCDFITPVPKPKRRPAKAAQSSMVFADEAGLTDEDQEYNPKPIINEIRSHVATWRDLPSDRDWGVTPATARLLHHWRRTEVEGLRPFFCQVEAVETVIWLTEGWDANTVTHILGVRAFGTQLLCEQVVGRGLRRQSYELNEHGLFDVEYADVLGIPFDFTAKPIIVKPPKPKLVTRVHAVKERTVEHPELEITFPRVEGYRVDLPEERISASFTEDSRLVVDPEMIGPSRVTMQGIVGETEELTAQGVGDQRPSAIAYSLAAHLLKRFGDGSADLPVHLFGQVRRVVRDWLDGGYLVLKGVPMGVLDYLEIKDQAAERIFLACQRYEHGPKAIKAILDPYNPLGSSRHVGFTTSKGTYATDPRRSHVSHVVCDSTWEAELTRVLETHKRVVAFVKNQGLGLEVPYRDGSKPRRYIPDMVVKLDDGHGPDDLLNLILETKGYRKGDAQLKAETMKTMWVPGVNNLGTHGRWAFAEFTDAPLIESDFATLIDKLTRQPVSVDGA